MIKKLLRDVVRRRRRAVVTLAIGLQAKALLKHAKPAMEAYARRVGATLHVIDRNPFVNEGGSNFFAKLELGRYLERYDRVIYLDSDIIVALDAPDLFELVPEDVLGVYLEGAVIDRTAELRCIKHKLGAIPGWTSASYFNTGVMVLGRAHRALFDTPNCFKMGTQFHDQTYLNWKAQSLRIPLFSLDARGNAMYPYVANATEGWFVHYAGFGFLPPHNWQERPNPFPFKFYQMAEHAQRLAGRRCRYFHPEQFVRQQGQLRLQPSELNWLYCPPSTNGVVAYGPFLPVAAGLYRVRITYAQEEPAKGLKNQALFRFDLASESGARIWHAATVDDGSGDVLFEVQLSDIRQLEVRFWAMGAPMGFSIKIVELEQLAAAGPGRSSATSA